MVGFPPKLSILIGFSIIKPAILGYHHFSGNPPFCDIAFVWPKNRLRAKKNSPEKTTHLGWCWRRHRGVHVILGASTLCSNGTMNTARLCCKKSPKLRNFCKDVTHFHASLKYSGIRYTWVSGVLSSLVYAPAPIHKYGRAGTKKLTCHVGMGMPKLKALLCWAFLHPFWAERIEIKNYHNSLNSFLFFFFFRMICFLPDFCFKTFLFKKK